MKDLEDRSLTNILNEKENLTNCYKNCEEIFKPNISEHGKKALRKIQDAIDAIEEEIQNRIRVFSKSSTPPNEP